jgi:Cft2 family RNA processing exonuclease
VIAGYCVEGTLAKFILTEPKEVTLMSGLVVPLEMSVHYISFSAHADYTQTAQVPDIWQTLIPTIYNIDTTYRVCYTFMIIISTYIAVGDVCALHLVQRTR